MPFFTTTAQLRNCVAGTCLGLLVTTMLVYTMLVRMSGLQAVDAVLQTAQSNAVQRDPADPAQPKLAFNGQRSYGYLKTLCDYGNRMSGSPGMKQQQSLLEKHFRELGASVSYQRFKAKDPLNGRRVPMANMIVQWHPDAERRILLCAHYDTRPLPDRELNPRLRQNGVFVGANDGASGVALLMELGNHARQLPINYGLDFVLFDGEELVYFDGRKDIGSYFAGSTWFARQYATHPPQHQYVAGVLFDMVADAQLTLYQEKHSATWKETRPLVKEIWGTAQRLGIKEFIPRAKSGVNDDSFPFYQI
ncbi:MAG: M28 family peptidase [Bythopirellula sp.]